MKQASPAHTEKGKAAIDPNPNNAAMRSKPCRAGGRYRGNGTLGGAGSPMFMGQERASASDRASPVQPSLRFAWSIPQPWQWPLRAEGPWLSLGVYVPRRSTRHLSEHARVAGRV